MEFCIFDHVTTISCRLKKSHSPAPTGDAVKTGNFMTRRSFINLSAFIGTGLFMQPLHALRPYSFRSPRVMFGLVTDVHYADTDHRNDRYYRESVAKLEECVRLMNERKVDFLIELGDFKDQSDQPSIKETLGYLRTIENILAKFNGPRYHVLGNHDMDSLSKNQFLSNIENSGFPMAEAYYSFSRGECHFLVLDANFRSDGTPYDQGNYDWKDANIPPNEMEWLRQELQAARRPVIVFIHQKLDGEGDTTVRNAAEVREILQDSGKVLAVFQGHEHSGGYSCIENIHYYTLNGMIVGSGPESSSYAITEVFEDHIKVTGFRQAESRDMPTAFSLLPARKTKVDPNV